MDVYEIVNGIAFIEVVQISSAQSSNPGTTNDEKLKPSILQSSVYQDIAIGDNSLDHNSGKLPTVNIISPFLAAYCSFVITHMQLFGQYA